MLTQEYLKECLHYNPDTGVFTWKERPRIHFKTDRVAKRINSMFCGNVAGYNDRSKRANTNYIKIGIDGTQQFAHRLAFLYMTGGIPEQVDHKDQNGLNNKWSNLIASTPSHNARNRHMHPNNKSGFNGVRFCNKTNRWIAQFGLNGKKVKAGYFKSFKDAVNKRKEINIKHNFSENHGT